MPRIAPRAFRLLLSIPVNTQRTVSYLSSLLPARTSFHPIFSALASRPSIFQPSLTLGVRHKGNTYGDEYQPSTRKRKRKFGFLHRLKKHPKLLARRRAKGPLYSLVLPVLAHNCIRPPLLDCLDPRCLLAQVS